MKRGTPSHPKTLDLAVRLGVPRWGAAGILENLWHFAAQYARRGDIGRRSDAAIAYGIGWEQDPATLIAALCCSGFLDRCRCHRLRIHDWPDHADQSVERSDEVKSLGFIKCYSDPGSKLENSSLELENSSLPLPSRAEPKPEPLPEPLPEPSLAEPAADPPACPAAAGPPVVEETSAVVSGNGSDPGEADPERLRVEIDELVAERSAASGQSRALVLAQASRTPNGQVITRLETCKRVGWLRTTRDRLIEQRLADAANDAEARAAPLGAKAQKNENVIRAMVTGGLKGDGTSRLPAGRGKR